MVDLAGLATAGFTGEMLRQREASTGDAKNVLPEAPEALLQELTFPLMMGLRTTQSLLTIRPQIKPSMEGGQAQAVTCWSWSLRLSKSESCQLHVADDLPVEASLVWFYTAERLN